MSKHAQCTTPHGGSEVVDGESQSEDKETEWDDCCASLLDKLQKVPSSVFAWPHKLKQNQPSTCKSASCTTQRTSVQQAESGSSKKNHWLYLPRPCSVMPVEKSSLSRSQYSGPISSQENTYLEAKERFKTKEKCEQCWGTSQWERAHSCRTLPCTYLKCTVSNFLRAGILLRKIELFQDVYRRVDFIWMEETQWIKSEVSGRKVSAIFDVMKRH